MAHPASAFKIRSWCNRVTYLKEENSMHKTLLVNASPYEEYALGYRLAKKIIVGDQPLEPSDRLIERNLVATPLKPLTSDYVTALVNTRLDDSVAPALMESECLIRELEQSTRLVIALPMHNFNVPAALKLWIDHVVRINRTFVASAVGKVGLLSDRPTIVLISSGGMLQENDSQPDFVTPYLKLILGTIGIHDIHFVYLEGLAFGGAAIETSWHQAQADLAAAGLLKVDD